MAKIKHAVPVVQQKQNPICWVACAAMILSYKKSQKVTIGDLLNGFDPSNACIPNPAKDWDTLYKMLENWGIKSVRPHICPAEAFITNTLRSDGPFILTHYTKTLAPSSSSVGTHAVVITGIDTDKHECSFNNPWGTSNNTVASDTILGSMERLWLANIKSVAFCV